jgi:hypothetical protein
MALKIKLFDKFLPIKELSAFPGCLLPPIPMKVAISYATAYGFILLSVSAISSFATARS